MKDTRERKTNSTPGKEPLRLLALSDGLFATVLTLLVLDLRLPDTLTAGSGDVTVLFNYFFPLIFK